MNSKFFCDRLCPLSRWRIPVEESDSQERFQLLFRFPRQRIGRDLEQFRLMQDVFLLLLLLLLLLLVLWLFGNAVLSVTEMICKARGVDGIGEAVRMSNTRTSSSSVKHHQEYHQFLPCILQYVQVCPSNMFTVHNYCFTQSMSCLGGSKASVFQPQRTAFS